MTSYINQLGEEVRIDGPKLTLGDLVPGDIFTHAATPKGKRFIVIGPARFNPKHGSPTRLCRACVGGLVSKSCRLEVVKTGENDTYKHITQ